MIAVLVVAAPVLVALAVANVAADRWAREHRQGGAA